MYNAGKAAVEYTKAMQDLDDQRNSLIVTEAEVEKQVTLATLATKDQSKSLRERLGLLDQAGAAEKKLSETRLKIERDELATLVKRKAANTANQDADRKEVSEKQAAVIKAELETLAVQQTIQNRRSALLEQEKAQGQKNAEDKKKLQKEVLDNNSKVADLELAMAEKLGKDTSDLAEKAIRAKLASDLQEVKKGSKLRKALELAAESEIAEARTANAVTENERYFKIQQSGLSARLSVVKKGTQEEADIIKEQITAQAQLDRLSTVTTIKNAKEQAAKLAEIDASETAQKLVVDNNLKTKLAQNGVTAIQARLNAVRQGSDEEYRLRKDLLDAQLKAELANTTLTQEQIAEIKSRYAKAQADVDNERLVAQRNAEVVSAEIALNKTKEGSQKAYKAQKVLIEKQRAERVEAAKKDAKAVELINSEAAKAQSNLDDAHLQQIIDQATDTANRIANTISTVFEIQAQIAAKALDKQQEAALKSAGNNADLRAAIEEDFQKRKDKLEKEGAQKRKAIARVEAAINTAVAITKALTSGGVLGPVLAAVVALQGLAQQALISQQEFAAGGIYQSNTNGPLVRGSGGPKDDRVNAKLSNGEGVVTAKAVELFGPLLSMINQAGGGRAFPGHPPVSYGVPNAKMVGLSYGAYANGGVVNNINSAIDMTQLSKMIGREVDAALRSNPMFVAVTDIKSVSSAVQAREQRNRYTISG
jgi:hypothetical protein